MKGQIDLRFEREREKVNEKKNKNDYLNKIVCIIYDLMCVF